MEIPYTVKPRPDTGLYNAKLGIWLFLASEVMLFGALFSSYVLLRVGAEPGTWSMGLMDIYVGAGNTMVLIASSMFVVLAWAQLKQGNLAGYKKWKWATIACAVLFLMVKWSYEWPSKFAHYDVWLNDAKVLHEKFEKGYHESASHIEPGAAGTTTRMPTAVMSRNTLKAFTQPVFSRNQAIRVKLNSRKPGRTGHLRFPATSTPTRKPRSILALPAGRRTSACQGLMPLRSWPSSVRTRPTNCSKMAGSFMKRPITTQQSLRNTRLAKRALLWP